MSRLTRGDVLVALAIAAAGAWLGLRILGDYRASGGIPSFQQSAFGPAVLTACGRGYQNPDDDALPALKAFLLSRRDAFDCGELPATIPTLPLRPFHRVTMYMELVVAALWKTGPISWSSVDRLNAAAFGLDLALLFLLCRAFAGRVLSAAAAAAWAVSPLHLAIAVDLRDYVKAPFILGAATLIAWMLRSTSPRRAWLGAAAAAAAGIGSGFRTDVLLVLVPVVAAVAFAGSDTARRRLLFSGAAVALFAIVSLPILRGYTGGGVISHVLLLGLTSPFDAKLGLETPMYRVGPVYHDAYVFSLVWDWTNRAEGEARAREMTFGSPQHDAATTAYFRSVVARLPADLLLRALAAARRSVTVSLSPPYDAALPWIGSPGLRRAIALRAAALPALLLILPFALLLAWIAAVRCGWRTAAAIAVLALTFPAASALQFHERHVFYLEVIPLCAFVSTVSAVWALAWRRERPVVPARRTAAAFATVALAAAVVAAGYALAAAVQARQLASLFERYERLPAAAIQWQTAPLASGGRRLTPLTAPASAVSAPFHVLELDRTRCGLALFRFVLRYHSPAPADDVTFDGWVNLLDAARMRVYFPIVAMPRLGVAFDGLELPARAESCIAAWKVAEVPPQLPKFVAQLPEDWRTLPLRQKAGTDGGLVRRDGTRVYLNDVAFPVDAAVVQPKVSGVIERIGDERPNGYLLRAPASDVREGDAFVLEGRADRGGFVVGLQTGGQWGPLVNVARKGAFLVVLHPPSAGSYTVVVADDGGGGAHGITVARAGWLPRAP